MEFGDILYIILILVFIVFGFFKDLNKRKKNNNTNTEAENKNLGDVFKEVFAQMEKPQTPPPVPGSVRREQKKRPAPVTSPSVRSEYQFQSSMDLIMDFEDESSLSGYIFPDYDLDSPIDKQAANVSHPVLEDLTGNNRESEFQKAIIYSEILKRRY